MRRTVRLHPSLAFALSLLSFALFVLGDASEPKLISIYSPIANYSLSLARRGSHDYVGLLEILEPLGTVSSRVEAQNWRLRFNSIEGVFPNGAARVRIHGREIDLSAPFLLEGGRGLVPVDSLGTVLPVFLAVPVVFHASGLRLFIREEGTSYTTQLESGTPARLILNFSSPVNPRIATEPGKLRMTFTRDPIIASGPPLVSFNNATISAASFVETNGAAEITITSAVPLLASFGNDGRRITIAPAPSATLPAPSANRNSAAAPQSPPPLSAPPSSPGATTGSPAAAPNRIFVAIDPSHGGAETGATFSPTLVEKDVTLAWARQLRRECEARLLRTMLVRDQDIDLQNDQRAVMVNVARPAIYISLHAASEGKGARVYTALLSLSTPEQGLFLAWDHAQVQSLASSQAAAAAITAELGKNIPARAVVAALRPLGNIVVPAVALEVAPRNGDLADLADADYQRQVASSVVAALAALRGKLEAAQ